MNQFVGQDPGSRPTPLASNRDEVALFADGNGVVVDTTQLFHAVEAVARGEVDRAEVRSRLRKTTGHFLYSGD